MTKTSSEGHVAMLAFPFASHPGSIASVARRLAAAAPHVIFSFYSTAKSNKSLFSGALSTPENIKWYDVSDGLPEGYVFSGNPEDDINLFLVAAHDHYLEAMRAAEEETKRRISCVMSDAFLWFSGDMAEVMGVPWVPIWASGACSLSIHYYTDLIREKVGVHDMEGRENEILEFIPGLSKLRLGDLPSGVVFGDLESPFSVMLHKMGQALPKAAAVAVNSFAELESEISNDLKSKIRINILHVGPFNLTSPQPSANLDEYRCIPWLDKHKAASVAYIGFGTVATPTPKEVEALAEALEATGTPFLWSLRDHLKGNLPEGFLTRINEQGKVVPWVPQVEVLEHISVGVYITHCGWKSVLESISGPAVMICRPFFADHALNSRLVQDEWKIGVSVEGGSFTKTGTMKALELVFSSEEGKKMRENVGALKVKAKKAVGEEGSSTEDFKTLLKVILECEEAT